MKIYTLKANHDLMLPDGNKIKVGEVFEWTGSLGLFGSCAIVVGEKDVVGKKSAQLCTRAKESDETSDNGEKANVGE